MKNFMHILLFLAVLPLAAQQGNNWVIPGINYGSTQLGGFGINFSNAGNPKTFDIGNFNYWKYNSAPQSVSNCKGDLMVYALDHAIWNGQHQRLKDSITDAGRLNLLIPKPGDDSVFYYISSGGGNSNSYHYHVVDLRLDSGRGNVDTKATVIVDSVGEYAGFTKHTNDTDYWLLIKTNRFTVRAYLITKNGIGQIPVISPFLGHHFPEYSQLMRFSNTGKFIISSPLINTNGDSIATYIYNFDNRTGKCSNKRLVDSDKNTYSPIFGICFSPNDSFFYVQYNRYLSKPNYNYAMYQCQTYASKPNKTADTLIKLSGPTYRAYGMQLAPNNQIYFWISDSGYKVPIHSLSVIKYPDKKGLACGLVPYGFNLYPRSIYYQNVLFPCFNFPVKRIANKFNVSGADGCGYDTARFTFDGDSAFTYFRWYFGDGDSADGRSVLHQYAQPGSYYVRLACTLGPCGYRQWVGDSVHIKFKPTISIVPTSTYTCGKNTLDLDVRYRMSDTLRLWLNGLDTTIAVANSNQPITINHQFTTDTSGTFLFAAKATNSQCSDSAASVHSAFIEPQARAVFQTNNPASCGSSTFTFSDTSQLDSIVVKRTWALRQAQSDTTINTSQNQLNITLTDTGKYTVTLTQTTRQGCVDSLTKTDYVWVHPLPEPLIQVNGKMVNPVNMCFGDTATLSVTLSGGVPFDFAQGDRALWSTSDTSSTISVTKPGTFSVKVWDEWNCYATSEPVQLKWLPELKVTLYKTTDSLLAKPNRAVVTYEWLRNGQQYTIGSQQYLYHADSGAYQVIVTDSNGCTATSNYQKFFWTGVSTPLNMTGGVRLYPNPAGSTLFLTDLPHGNHIVTILDLAGKQILTERSNNETTIMLGIEHLASGIYFIEAAGQHLKFVKE